MIEDTDQEQPLLPSEDPDQDLSQCPKWEYKQRRDPKWGEVTKRGLVVGRGHKQRVVPPDEVWRLAEIGCTDKEIAEWFMIDENTLRYNFSVYMTKGRSALKRRLRSVQITTALQGNPTLLIWLGKNYLGQSDNPLSRDDNFPLPWGDDSQ
jgi:hypothetical protein